MLVAAQALAASTSIVCRIVDYGADMGDGYYRGTGQTTQTNTIIDAAGTHSVGFWAFSLTNPLNPPALEFDADAASARFYGGMTIVFSNRTGAAFTEGMLNKNHELRDDCNFMCTPSAPLPNWRAYGLWVWLKEDFMNGGAANAVAFDANSMIVPHVSRFYRGVTAGRWVARDGNQCYISQATFEQYSTNIGRALGTHTSYVLRPTETLWAPYNPSEPCWIMFDTATAVFAPHTFTDVTAVGFYLGRDRYFSSSLELKWHSFECYATVTRTNTPSQHVPMGLVPAGSHDGQAVPAFWLGATEVPYELWCRVWRQFTSNQRPMDLNAPGYSFDKNGDMGSMDFGTQRHGPREPVTDITWLDAVAWCNALSELEGATPCYYSDAALTNVFRRVKEREYINLFGQLPTVHVNWSANGFRLPTPREWLRASAGAPAPALSNRIATAPVGTISTNAYGCYDLFGNVWELTWDTSTNFYAPALHTNRVVFGGSFRGTNAPASAENGYGEWPAEGHAAIGLRVARSIGGMPPLGISTMGAPAWQFSRATRLAPASVAAPVTLSNQMVYLQGTNVYVVRVNETSTYSEANNHAYNRADEARVTVSPFYMSRNEITFAQWNAVCQWGMNQPARYYFDFDGDMGSMTYQTSARDHGPNEPVTGIGWYDAVLFCNALSEIEGRTPCYYIDEARASVCRRAHPWRIATVTAKSGYSTDTTRTTNIYVHWDADGYRLPTHAEWQVAYRERKEELASTTTFPWGSSAAGGTNTGWLRTNAGDSTQPVGQLPSNVFGIYDLAGNVSEWCWDWPGIDYYRAHNPKGDTYDARAGDFRFFGITYNGGNFGGNARAFESRYEDVQSAARPFLGLRIVRCDANVHPANDVFFTNIVLNIDPTTFDPLQGRVFRGNLRRTGVLESAPTSTFTGLKWAFQTGSNVMASPVVVGGVLFVGSDNGRFYALDANAGTQRWMFTTSPQRPIRCGACVVSGVVYFTAGNDLYAVDAGAGTQRWKYTRGSAFAVDNSPAVAYGTVFCGFEKWSGTAAISGIDSVTGREVWRFRAMDYPNNGPQGPAIDGAMLYTAGDDNVLFAGDLRTELLAWRGGGHHCYACVAVDSNTLYYMAQATLRAVNKETGASKWQYNGTITGDQYPRSSPAVHDGIACVGHQDSWVYAVNAGNGALKWKYKTGDEIWSSPTIAGDMVFIGSHDGGLYALDLYGSGTIAAPLWRYQTGGAIKSTPWVEHGVVFVGSDDGNVYAVYSNVPEPGGSTLAAALTILARRLVLCAR
jgi:formylglycine-generating enzyme required for sulfatase activity/outer membrane protein assembly factor BamB